LTYHVISDVFTGLTKYLPD